MKKADMRITCSCQDTSSYFELTELSQWNLLKDEFNKLRNKCTALKYILPDEQWEKLKDCDMNLDKSAHQSICIVAYVNRTLDKITKVLHEFVIDKTIQKQYEKDLIETWFSYDTKDEDKELELHVHSKIYQGKLYELIFAGLLKDNCFEIKDLSAWNPASPDIYALKEGQNYLIECKYIGQENRDFNNKLSSQAHRACEFNPQVIYNYIMCKLNEASEQFKKDSYGGKRVAVIIIDLINSYKLKYHNLEELRKTRFNNLDDYAIYTTHAYELTCLVTFRENSAFKIMSTILA